MRSTRYSRPRGVEPPKTPAAARRCADAPAGGAAPTLLAARRPAGVVPESPTQNARSLNADEKETFSGTTNSCTPSDSRTGANTGFSQADTVLIVRLHCCQMCPAFVSVRAGLENHGGDLIDFCARSAFSRRNSESDNATMLPVLAAAFAFFFSTSCHSPLRK